MRAPDGPDATPLDAILDRLDDLSPRIEAVGRGVALLDITGLEPLLGDERRVATRAVALARQVAPLPVRAGAGDNRWLAVLAARLARPSTPDAPAAFHALPAGGGAHRDYPHPPPPGRGAVRHAARPPPGTRPRGAAADPGGRPRPSHRAGAPRAGAGAGLDRAAADRSPGAGRPHPATGHASR